MMKHKALTVLGSFAFFSFAVACGKTEENKGNDEGLGGSAGASTSLPATGGSSTGGAPTGGETGGNSTGGKPGAGGEGGADPGCDESAPKPVLYLSGDGNLTDSISGLDAKTTGNVATAEAKFDEGFSIAPQTGGSYLTAAASDAHEIGTSDFSIAFWVKMTDGFEILDKRMLSGGIRGYHIYVYGGNIGLQIADGADYNNFNSSNDSKVNDGKWHHVAVTVDRDSTTGIKFYQDGTLVGTMNPTAYQGSLTSEAPLLLAAHASDQSSTSFNGALDEFQIYKQVLTADEVATLGTQATLDYCK